MVSETAATTASPSNGRTILIACGILFLVGVISATVRMDFGVMLGDCRVALSATAPHEEEED
jgi:hypothetical protein